MTRKPVTPRSGAEPTEIVGLDELKRSVKAEEDLNSLFATVFQGEKGDRALTYLRIITQQRILPPGASDAELRYLEGQRRLVAIIMERVRYGRERR